MKAPRSAILRSDGVDHTSRCAIPKDRKLYISASPGDSFVQQHLDSFAAIRNLTGVWGSNCFDAERPVVQHS